MRGYQMSPIRVALVVLLLAPTAAFSQSFPFAGLDAQRRALEDESRQLEAESARAGAEYNDLSKEADRLRTATHRWDQFMDIKFAERRAKDAEILYDRAAYEAAQKAVVKSYQKIVESLPGIMKKALGSNEKKLLGVQKMLEQTEDFFKKFDQAWGSASDHFDQSRQDKRLKERRILTADLEYAREILNEMLTRLEDISARQAQILNQQRARINYGSHLLARRNEITSFMSAIRESAQRAPTVGSRSGGEPRGGSEVDSRQSKDPTDRPAKDPNDRPAKDPNDRPAKDPNDRPTRDAKDRPSGGTKGPGRLP